jgi:surface carbohydrate biosynthesis protein
MQVGAGFFSLLHNITIRDPKRTKILIYDYAGSEILIETILQGQDYSAFPVRLESFYISPQILLKIAKNFFLLNFQNIKEFKRNIYRAYTLSCMEYINPKIVITFVDNDFTFQWLSNNYHNAEFFAIQNGVRIKSCLTIPDTNGGIRKISMPHFLCFGQSVVDTYRKFGHEIADPVCLGSLKGGYYKQITKETTSQNIFDICIISQNTSPSKEILHEDWIKNEQVILEMMVRYLKNNDKRAVIALRTSIDEEYEFFLKMFGDKATIVRQDKTGYSTYRTMDHSEVIVTNHSTAGFEAFGWGKKVLFCNFTGDTIYEIFNRDLFLVRQMDYDLFEKRMNELLEMDQNEYLKTTEILRKYVMNFDPALPAHMYMKKIIETRIRDKNQTQ